MQHKFPNRMTYRTLVAAYEQFFFCAGTVHSRVSDLMELTCGWIRENVG